MAQWSTSAGGGSAPFSRGLVVMRDQVVPADRLADCVWGDVAPANWCFERAVDAASSLAPPDAVRALDDALRLWRGPPYAEYAGES